MKRIKKIFAVLASSVMMMSGAALLPASADETAWEGDLGYVIDEKGVKIVDCNADAAAVEIPSEIDGVEVYQVKADSFNSCKNLTAITVEEGNALYCSVDGVLYSADKTTLVRYPVGKEGTAYTVPEGVTAIEASSFCNTNLEEIHFPSEMKTFGFFAFRDCIKLKKMILPEGLTYIGDSIFESCRALEEIQLPDTLETIHQSAFRGCRSLKEIEIPDSVKTIEMGAFYYCEGLTSVKLPSSLEAPEQNTFYRCTNLKELYLPSGITEIPYGFTKYCTAMTDVYYDGLQSEWEEISIHESNEELFACNIHFSDGTVLKGTVSAGAVPGDANLDGTVTIVDVVFLNKAIMGTETLTPEQEAAVDCDHDGDVSAQDSLLILKSLVDLVTLS